MATLYLSMIKGGDMTEIEQLIKQAVKWRKPAAKPELTKRTWQEVLDNQPYPRLNVKNL